MGKYVIINIGKSFQKARNEIKLTKEKNPKKIIGITGFDDELNRKILEKEKIGFYIPLLSYRKDFSKQRNSGFNQVMAKICKKGKILVGINLDELLKSNEKDKPRIIARIRQNIDLCKKDKLKMAFVQTKNMRKQDLLSLGIVLGMPTWMPHFFN